MKVLTPDEMRAVDNRAINEMGIPGIRLMENAGRAVADWVLDHVPHAELVVVLAGHGNNGGDGLVAARYISENDRDVKVVLLRDGKELSPDCKVNFDALPTNIEIFSINDEKELKAAVRKLKAIASNMKMSPIAGDAVFIDALLGTGVQGEIRGLTVDLLNAAQNIGWPTVACDIPSGINGTDGSYLGAGIPALATVTMGLPKSGLYLNAGVEYSGEVVVADIGFPPEATDPAKPLMETIESDKVAKLFSDDRGKPDEAALHKGDFGRILVAAGSRGMLGANELTSRAALRAGCGMVVSAVPSTEYYALAARTGPEIMTAPIASVDSAGCFAPEGIGDLMEYFDWADVLAIGPGFSDNDEAMEFARLAVREFPNTPDHQIIIDADGLKAFIDDLTPLAGRHRPPILTPHQGEFARLTAPHDLPEGKLERLMEYAKLSDCVIVLKGARTLIATPRETAGCPVAVNVESGNPGMATAGSGDVLTGILAGLAGQPTISWDPYQIACVGVFVHGFAGDLAGRRLSRQGMIAGDIIDSLPAAFKYFRRRNQRREPNSRVRRRR